MARPREPIYPRFITKIDFDGPIPAHMTHLGPCWEWVGAVGKRGYGLLTVNNRPVYAHRLALAMLLGHPLESSEHTLHHCDNSKCVRPDHLFLGDQATNIRDLWEKRRHPNWIRTHCSRGHLYSGRYRRQQVCKVCHRMACAKYLAKKV